MMTAPLVTFWTGMIIGRIDWPIDGLLMAIVLTLSLALLLMGLLSERAPDTAVRSTPTRLRPSRWRRSLQQQAA